MGAGCGCLEGVLGAAAGLRGEELAKALPAEPAGPSGDGGTVLSNGTHGLVGGAVLSKNQQKKQAKADQRQEKKGQKKVQKQADALEVALAAIGEALPPSDAPPPPPSLDGSLDLLARRRELRGRLCATFGVARGYRELPAAHGPTPAEGLEALGSSLVRPPKYHAKFLPQEYSLLHKVWSMLGGDCEGAGVLDIGAGNANCATLAASLLGLTVVCVERESPREELRAEAQLPPGLRQKVIRYESDVEDFTSESLLQVARQHGLRRVIVMAKHPCGIGVDRSIDCAARLSAAASADPGGGMPKVMGCILATCCTNKLCLDDFRVSRVAEFCSRYEGDVPLIADGTKLARIVEVMSRCSAWRTAAGSLGNAVHEEQLEWAELFEDSLQALRLRRLQRLFGEAAELRFAPSGCTLQDRCLLASSTTLPAGLWAHGDVGDDGAFLRQIRHGVDELIRGSGPIDCRPKGLRSAKYDFDYTDDAALRD